MNKHCCENCINEVCYQGKDGGPSCPCHQVTPYNQLDHSHCFDQETPACGIEKKLHSICCLCAIKNPRWIKKMEESTGKDFSHQVTPEEGVDITNSEVAQGLKELLDEPSPIQVDWEKDLTGIMMSHEVHVFQKINNQVYPDLAISRSAIKDLEKVVKVFISNLLNSEKARILEKVRGMKKKSWLCRCAMVEICRGDCPSSWTRALEEVEKLLNPDID